MPVLGSGHPQADVMLLKHAPSAAEIEEGVAFYGRSGNAVMKSLKRLGIDPLVVYGTLCVKCPLADPALASPNCIARLVREVAIVEPRCVVVMGEEALDCLNDVGLPLAEPVEAAPGEIQPLTPTIDAIFTPDIDAVARLRGQPSGTSGAPSAPSASGTRTCLPTDRRPAAGCGRPS